MDVCHLNLAAEYRGGERQTELLVRGLASRGYAQRLVIRRGHELANRCADVQNLDVCEVASNLLAAAHGVKGATIAHAHDGRSVYAALLANLVYNIPYVLTRRVVAPQSPSQFRSLAYRRASTVAAVSKAAARELQVRQPDVEPVVVADATADFESDEAEVARIRGKYRGKILIGHIGALDNSHKGQSTIIEVARMVATSHPHWHFLLCGNGKDEDRFRQEIGSLTNIELMGWVNNVGDYLAAFDVFVYPSLHEALGSTLLDAMQFGLPIVATNVGGIPDFVEDGDNGVLVAPGDPARLKEGIDRLLSDNAMLVNIRERNRTKSQRYDVTHMVDAYETLYRDIRAQV